MIRPSSWAGGRTVTMELGNSSTPPLRLKLRPCAFQDVYYVPITHLPKANRPDLTFWDFPILGSHL